jgi:hypothetical protein
VKTDVFKAIDDLTNIRIRQFDFTKDLQEKVAKKLAYIIEQREEIITAFIAKYGCQPDEIEQVEERYDGLTKWYVRKKDETNRA